MSMERETPVAVAVVGAGIDWLIGFLLLDLVNGLGFRWTGPSFMAPADSRTHTHTTHSE